MRKIKLYIATSLDGKIAKADGSVDWLESIPLPEDGDYGYAEFYKTIDTTIQGYSTYNQVLNWGVDFPYPEKKNYVITRKKGLVNTEFVEFISDNHIDFVKALKQEEGKDIWLVGGSKINSMFLEANLIDEIQVFIMPIILTDGIDLFAPLNNQKQLNLFSSKTHPNGVIESLYALG